jgi:hypothetical protein
METGGNFIIRGFMIVRTKCHSGDRIEKSEVAVVCGWYGKGEKYKWDFGEET